MSSRHDAQEAFRRRMASSLEEPFGTSSAGSLSSSSTSAVLQPQPFGRGSLGLGTMGISTTPVPGSLSVGGLGGKFGINLGTVVEMSSISDICGGVINSREGGVVRMCTKTSSCATIAHKKTKSAAVPSSPMFFIQPRGTSSVLPTPTLARRECSQSMLDTLLSKDKRTVDEWISFFTDCQTHIDAEKMLSSLSIKNEDSGYESIGDDDIGSFGNVREYESIKKIEEQEPPMFSNLDEQNDSGIASRAITNVVATLNEVGVVLEMVDIMMNESCVEVNTLRQQFVTLNGLTKDIGKTIGDAKYIKEEFGSIGSALSALVAQGDEAATSIEAHELNFVDMQSNVEDLIMIANQAILVKFQELSQRVSNSVQGGSNPSSVVTTSMLFDGRGSLNPDLSVGEVDGQNFTLRELVLKLMSLDSDVQDLSAKIRAKGGITVGNSYFPSYDNLVGIIKTENPSANTVSCFVDAQLIFGHVKTLTPREQKDTASLNKDLSVTDSTLIDIATATYPLIEPYTGTAKDYTPGASLDCFKSKEVWSGAGHSAGQGREAKIADQARAARSKVENIAQQKLKNAPTLLALALEMARRSEDWHLELHKYFTAEQSVLGALKLPDDDIFQLFSEVFQLIAESWHVHRSAVHVVGDNIDPVERLATYIWSTLRVHEIMEEFVIARFKHHPIIQSAFVRFLTRKTGENTSAALAAKIAAIDKEMKSVKEASGGAKRDCVTLTKKLQTLSDNHDQFIRRNDLKK